MKRYYKIKEYTDISDELKDFLYKLGWRRIPGTAKPEYISLPEGKLAYVTQSGKLKERKPGKNGGGYCTVKLKQVDGSYKSFLVHRLVLMFKKNPEHKPLGHHKDHDKTNNSALNIEPATYKENANK